MPGPLGLGAVVVVPVAGDDAVVCAKHVGPINIPVSKTASNLEIFMEPIVLNKVEIRKEKIEGIRGQPPTPSQRGQKSEVRSQTSAALGPSRQAFGRCRGGCANRLSFLVRLGTSTSTTRSVKLLEKPVVAQFEFGDFTEH